MKYERRENNGLRKRRLYEKGKRAGRRNWGLGRRKGIQDD